MNSGILETDLTRTAVARLEKIWGSHLSRRELEVGSLAIDGHSTQQIAERLFISENTVKTHLRNLFRKTKTRGRAELYRQLVEASLANPPSPKDDPKTEGEVQSGQARLMQFLATAPLSTGLSIALIQLNLKEEGATPPFAPVQLLDLLAPSIRLGDQFFHWQDNLYLLALPGSGAANAREVANRLVRKVRRWAAMKELQMEAAIGVATWGEGRTTPRAIVEAAHSRMRPIHFGVPE